jgi:hypothetical protein
VFVREVAGVGDATAPKQSGSGRHRERAYEVAVIRSRAQLLELAERGNRARERVGGLLAPFSPIPLTTIGLGLTFELCWRGRDSATSYRPREHRRQARAVYAAGAFPPVGDDKRGLGAGVERGREPGRRSWIESGPRPARSYRRDGRASARADPRHIDDFSKKLDTIYRLVVDALASPERHSS